MLAFLVLLFVPQIFSKFYPQNVTDLSKCAVYYSRLDNSYKDFYKISQSSHTNGSILDFHFSVLTPSDAQIMISPVAKPNITEPVYEIVLGAGGNSFSDIRRAQRASVKTTTTHPKGLLSALDPQSFWIHISRDGVIEVGREGEEVAFINWRDPDPLPVKFFSFGTWAGVEAKWFFDCPRGDNTTNIEKVKVLSSLELLRRHLLNSYDPYVRPVLNHTDVIAVSISLNAHHISLDEHKSALNVEGMLSMNWTDNKLKWNPKDYGNITSLHLVGRQIWQPDLILLNGVALLKDDFLDNSMMVLNSKGMVNWNPVAHINVWCDAEDLGHWPSDNHTCDIKFGFASDSNFLRLRLIQLDKIFGNQFGSEWIVLDGWMTNGPTFVTLRLQMRRDSQIYDALFISPFLFVAICMLLTFCVSPFDFSKISLCCLQLLITTVVSVILFGAIPAHPSKLPYLVFLYSMSFFASAFCIGLSTIVINISRFPHTKPVPHCLWQTLMLKPVKKAFFLPSVKTAQKYGKFDGSQISLPKISENVQNTWIVLGIFIDRLAFVTFLIFIVVVITHKY